MSPRSLSPREAVVLSLIADGRTNRQIADFLLIERKTVKNYVRRIYAKLGAGSRPAAAATWSAT
jgi:DNA-binding CsgD family transcriptional regulator